MTNSSPKDLKPFFKVTRTKFGFVANFMNAHDKKPYFQSTIRKRPFVFPPPARLIRDGVERRIGKFGSIGKFEGWQSLFPPGLISCETRTYLYVSRHRAKLIMSCLVGLFGLEQVFVMKRMGGYRWLKTEARFTDPELERFATAMATVFQNADISCITANNGEDDPFEGSGWQVTAVTKIRLQIFTRPWRRYSVALLFPAPETADEFRGVRKFM